MDIIYIHILGIYLHIIHIYSNKDVSAGSDIAEHFQGEGEEFVCVWVPAMNELIVWGKNCHLEDLRDLKPSVYMKSSARFGTIPNDSYR